MEQATSVPDETVTVPVLLQVLTLLATMHRSAC